MTTNGPMDVEEILDIGVTAITDAMKNFPDGDIKDYISEASGMIVGESPCL